MAWEIWGIPAVDITNGRLEEKIPETNGLFFIAIFDYQKVPEGTWVWIKSEQKKLR